MYTYVIHLRVLNLGQGTRRINRLASIPVCNSYEPVARQTSMKENALKTGK